MDVYGTDLKLKMRVQIENNTLYTQEAAGSSPALPTTFTTSGLLPHHNWAFTPWLLTVGSCHTVVTDDNCTEMGIELC